MSAPRTARDLARKEVTRQILEVARAHLAREGATALSLRSIAKDLEMAPSAIYRYFAGRDELLNALILAAYDSLADAAELASRRAYQRDDTDAHRWLDVPRSVRQWALAHAHEWALVFGSPVPGYHAPELTVVPYTRLAAALVRPVVDAHRSHRLQVSSSAVVEPDPMAAALQPVIDGLLPGLPTITVGRAMQAWATLVGMVSLETFGHWRNTVLDPQLLFEETIGNLAHSIGLRT